LVSLNAVTQCLFKVAAGDKLA